MFDSWSSLAIEVQIFYIIAIPATLILVLQAILSIIGLAGSEGDMDGGDFDSDGDIDFDGDADVEFDVDDMDMEDVPSADFKFFTIRGMVAFFSIFGWTGILMLKNNSLTISVIVAFLAGSLAMALVGYLFYLMTRLQASGNIDYKNCLNKTGEVYLTIPASKKGRGKVNLTVQGRYIEINAMTEMDEPIPSGETIIVVKVISDNTVIVKKI